MISLISTFLPSGFFILSTVRLVHADHFLIKLVVLRGPKLTKLRVGIFAWSNLAVFVLLPHERDGPMTKTSLVVRWRISQLAD